MQDTRTGAPLAVAHSRFRNGVTGSVFAVAGETLFFVEQCARAPSNNFRDRDQLAHQATHAPLQGLMLARLRAACSLRVLSAVQRLSRVFDGIDCLCR